MAQGRDEEAKLWRHYVRRSGTAPAPETGLGGRFLPEVMLGATSRSALATHLLGPKEGPKAGGRGGVRAQSRARTARRPSKARLNSPLNNPDNHHGQAQLSSPPPSSQAPQTALVEGAWLQFKAGLAAGPQPAWQSLASLRPARHHQGRRERLARFQTEQARRQAERQQVHNNLALVRHVSSAKRAVDARCDLHGLSVADAYWVFCAFMRRALEQGMRCVEIITGIGRFSGGQIKHEARHWLENSEFRQHVQISVHPDPGNKGAIKVLLKRRR
ncbi:Smr/MutS family protein [Formicincola oecophyllae]|uniref:Smr/MutS family protein n=1 Tax=Formicincola oecophyllae TaxID=2558361 RepID=A0A4Y6UBS7_9PROT|nr:Smr/MutS family protein [Formicincola oecophyllae]QDH13926.1 Smr/MutS family protein [Formicincola oecophyllae]